MPPTDQLVPLITAALTLANTVVLFLINRRSGRIHAEMNGMKMQLLAEAELRGRRLASHDDSERPRISRRDMRLRRARRGGGSA